MMEQLHGIIDLIDRQSWLDKASKYLQRLVINIIKAGGAPALRVRDFLHGTWLGHPLHPVLTDIPIGSWSAAALLDTLEMTTGKKGYGAGADAAIQLGAAGAAVAAVTGIVDWHHTEHRPRRIGTVHAALNITALVLYLASLGMRSSRKRSAGRALAFAGFTSSLAAAYLGGHLVFGLKIGVDRSPDLGLPEEYTPVLPENELLENRLHRVVVNTLPVLLVRRNGRIYALAETCAHMGGPLAEGELKAEENGLPVSVICPWHASRFSLEDGRPLNGPSTYIQPCFETRISNGQIEVRAVKTTVD